MENNIVFLIAFVYSICLFFFNLSIRQGYKYLREIKFNLVE